METDSRTGAASAISICIYAGYTAKINSIICGLIEAATCPLTRLQKRVGTGSIGLNPTQGRQGSKHHTDQKILLPAKHP